MTTDQDFETMTDGHLRCTRCGSRYVPETGSLACPTCATDRVTPLHADWPASLKCWLVMRMLARGFAVWRTKQTSWERLLVGAFVAGEAPDGKRYAMTTTADTVYPIAVRLSAVWAASEQRGQFLSLIGGRE